MSIVLVVEDSSTQLQIMSDILQDSGVKTAVVSASDGIEALEQIQNNCPEQLPRHSGNGCGDASHEWV
jgi:CheY-like chemotaxis protein